MLVIHAIECKANRLRTGFSEHQHCHLTVELHTHRCRRTASTWWGALPTVGQSTYLRVSGCASALSCWRCSRRTRRASAAPLSTPLATLPRPLGPRCGSWIFWIRLLEKGHVEPLLNAWHIAHCYASCMLADLHATSRAPFGSSVCLLSSNLADLPVISQRDEQALTISMYQYHGYQPSAGRHVFWEMQDGQKVL